MAFDSSLNVLGEVRIDGSRRVFGQKRDALGNGTADGLRGMENGNGPPVILDDDLRPGAHSGHDRRDIGPGAFPFRGAVYIVPHKNSIQPTPTNPTTPPPLHMFDT